MLSARALVVGAVAVFVALLMVTPGGSGLGASPVHASPASRGLATSSHAAPSGAVAAENRILSELRASHAPTKNAFLPNLNVPARVESGTIVPTYAQAPAPMGIGDLGIQQIHGKNVGTVSYTSSVEASITVNALNSTYLDGFGPDSVSIQLNTVLTHVDLFGNVNNQFWVQNVPVYVESTHKLYIVDNIWNFSSSAFQFTPNSLYRYHGIEVPPVYYFANGPQWTTAEPFTVRVYNNASVMNDRLDGVPELFRHRLERDHLRGLVRRGRVQLDRTRAPDAPGADADVPDRRPAVRCAGVLPNDAEIMIGGSGDGATTSVSDVNATMSLATLPNASAFVTSGPGGVQLRLRHR